MTHLELSNELNSFSYNYYNSNIEELTISDEVKTRIILSRLYYALYHRLCEELPNFASLSGTNKHETLLKIIQKKGNTRLYIHLKNLKNARVSADYHLEISLNKNISIYLAKTYNFIKAKKLL